MRPIVFVGPTLDRSEVEALLPGAVVLGPAACGDVYRASTHNPPAIGLVDGYFDHRLSVWHKEVLWALSQGQRVYGASSMGALRAAELRSLGMIGVGAIFEQFASGELEDDDEVALVHDSVETGYRARSEAMVNLRATLAAATASGAINEATRALLVGFAKAQFYAERSFGALLEAAPSLDVAPAEAAALRAFLDESGPVNQKRLDARAMLMRMREDFEQGSAKPAIDFRFAYTNAWQVFRSKLDAEAARPDAPAIAPPSTPDDPEPWLTRLGRADPALAAAAWAEASERALALMLADAGRFDPNEALMLAELAEFRQARNLTDERFEAWLSENELDRASLSTLIYDEASIRRFREAARERALEQLPNALRALSAYARLKRS